ncbi:hypothetical protein VPH35_093468 [Triticum aestivum]
MEDKRKAVANNEERRQRQRREREVEDTATSGRTPIAGGDGTLPELPRVTAATTPALGPPPGASSQFGGAPGRGGGSGLSPSQWRLPTPVGNLALGRGGGSVHGVGNPDNGRLQIGNAGAPQGHGSTVIDQQRLRDQPSSSRARAAGCTCCGGAPTTRVVLNLPVCEACYRRVFQGLLQGNAPQQHAQIGYAGTPRGAVRNPVAVPTREQQFLANMDAPPRPFSMLPFRWGPANPALERQSSSPGCYSNIFTGKGPLFSNAGARAPQAQGHAGTAIDQQRQLELLRGQPSSSQARAPGCSSCGARATRVALKMPFCDACFRDTFMANAPPQHAQIGSKLPSPVPSYNYAQTGNAPPQHGNVSSSPVPTPSNAGVPQGQQQYRDPVVELLAATEPSPPAGSQRAAYSRCEACRLSGDKACMFCHNPGPPPPPPGQS